MSCSMPGFPAFRFTSIKSWCHPIISFSAFCPQSFPASGSLPVSQFLSSGGQNVGASASASTLPMNIQHGFPLGWSGLMCLPSKGLSRAFSSTTVWKYQLFSAQPSLWAKCHICTWLLESHQFSSVTQSCPTPYDSMDWSMPRFPVCHQLPEFAQIHVLWVSDGQRLSLSCPLLLLPSVFPSIMIFSSESALWVSSESAMGKP